MHFAQPQWLWIAALACTALAVLFVRAERKRTAAISRFAAASPETSVARTRRWLRNGLAMLGVAMACVALARPLAGFRWEQTPHQGVDLMFAIDTSKSMRAADIRPDRLTRAKLAVADLVRKFDGERVGLIAFAGDAFVQAPMTVDRDVFLESLDALDTDVIPKGGTDIASAIRAADQAMASEPDHQKVLVLVSDGEDLNGDALDAARAAGKQGLTIFTVGVGSQQGELIEVANAAGVKELVRDDAGQPVRSRLDEPMMRSLAQVTGGAYAPLGADGRGLDALYTSVKARLPHNTAAGTARKVYTERYQIPLAIALGCLMFELVLGDRRRSRSSRAAAAAAGMGLLFLPHLAAAAPAPDAVRAYNTGTATYRKGDFAAAQQAFDAATHTDDVRVQTDAYYDLGNARYRAGQATLAKNRDATIATWKQALAAYDTALGVTPGDADAKFNRDFVARKLAALEQQKKQDEDKKQQQQDKQPKDQQSKNQKDQGKQPKDQKGQGQPKDQQAKNQQGQGQPKDQNGQGQPKDQQAKNQQGQGQPKDQNGQGQPKDRQAKNQQGQGQPKDQQAKNQQGQGQPEDHKPQGQQAKGDPAKNQPPHDAPDAGDHAKQAQNGKPDVAAAQEAAARAADDATRRAAGEMTHGEAVQLLDSVESELKPMPIHGRVGGRPEQTKIKDW